MRRRGPPNGCGFRRPEGPLFRPLLTSIALASLLLGGCLSSSETLQEKLEEIGKSDLQDILNDLPPKAKGAVLAKPYFKVDAFREFPRDSAIVFQAYAKLVFFYLDPDLDLCQVRKYRYKTSSRIWDRYEVKLVHVPAKYSGNPP